MFLKLTKSLWSLLMKAFVPYIKKWKWWRLKITTISSFLRCSLTCSVRLLIIILLKFLYECQCCVYIFDAGNFVLKSRKLIAIDVTRNFSTGSCSANIVSFNTLLFHMEIRCMGLIKVLFLNEIICVICFWINVSFLKSFQWR